MEKTPKKTGKNGRDNAGRFTPGNKAAAGHGRPRNLAERAEAFRDAITEDDLKDVSRAIVDAAKDGDMAAAKLLLNYLCGTPRPQQNEAEDCGDVTYRITIPRVNRIDEPYELEADNGK